MSSKLFDRLFMLIGILIQIVVFYFSNAGWLSLVSGITGIISVVLCSQRKISFYVFGYIQLITYVILCISQNFYGEIAENIFYAITMLFGLYTWSSNYTNNQLDTRSLSKYARYAVSLIMIVSISALWGILKLTKDTQPFMDSVSTVPAIIGQILMIMRYKENWIFWLIIDIASIIMWAIAGDWCMVSQFVFWSANCIYGYIKWNK